MAVVMREETFFPAMDEEEDSEDEKRNSACLGESLQCLHDHKTEDLFFECLELLKDSSFFTGYSKNIDANQDLHSQIPPYLTSNSAFRY